MTKKKVAIVAGGDSGEFEISIKSADVVKQHLDGDRYIPYLIIMQGNDWIYRDEDGIEYPVNKDDFSLILPQGKTRFDIVFIAIHGTPGEDGKLQGYLDMLKMPYTTCDQFTSALTFNKYYCSRIVSSFNVLVAPSVILYRSRDYDVKAIINETGLPCFVKPNKGGSSVGMSKVKQEIELRAAVERAFLEDAEVIVERFIPGREITCGVLNWEGKVRSLPVTEIISKNEFFDYEAKYTDGVADEVTPARISADVEKQCRLISESLYVKLNCKGFVRFDYIFNDGGMYFLEVNTIPGLSPNSIVPQQAMADGITLSELFSMAIEQTLV